jgi:hypothetical protein
MAAYLTDDHIIDLADQAATGRTRGPLAEVIGPHPDGRVDLAAQDR